MLRTTSVSPLDRDKDRVLDPGKMLPHFPVPLERGCFLAECWKRILYFGRMGIY